MAKPDWFQSYDGMPEPMPPVSKKRKPKPTPKPTPTSKSKVSKGGGIGDTYTTSIGAAGMSFDHKMS